VKKTTLYVPDALYHELKALARRQNRPAAALIREALAAYVGRAAKAGPPVSLGAGHSGSGDVASRTEELLGDMGRS